MSQLTRFDSSSDKDVPICVESSSEALKKTKGHHCFMLAFGIDFGAYYLGATLVYIPSINLNRAFSAFPNELDPMEFAIVHFFVPF